MARKALIRESDGHVENVIVAGDDFPAPEGRILVASETAGPGDMWDGTEFIHPSRPPKPPAPEPELTDDELRRLRELIAP